jgi:hypothetical protein
MQQAGQLSLLPNDPQALHATLSESDSNIYWEPLRYQSARELYVRRTDRQWVREKLLWCASELVIRERRYSCVSWKWSLSVHWSEISVKT